MLNVTRQNLRNKNPITSFLFAKGIFDFTVNSTCNGETERKCAPILLNFDYWLNVSVHIWIRLHFSGSEYTAELTLTVEIDIFNILNLLPNFTAIFVTVKIPATDVNIYRFSLISCMILDILICLCDLLLYCCLQVSLILFFDLHIVLVCHLTLIF